MRALKAENLKYTTDVTKLNEKNIEATRKLHLAESAEKALKTQLKSAESAARGLKEEVARTKALVAQTRTSCATEVRRRDRQIDTMKKQLTEAGRARGTRGSPGITMITLSPNARQDKALGASGASTADDDYSLRNETNAFLANLAQNLSEENEALLRVMRRALDQLREMSGCNAESNQESHVVKQPGWEDLSADLESVLDHMRTILTNPSFVPIEEVTVREEEIMRLRDGWFKMESRWKEAVHLIDGWRKRMADSGKPIGEEELQLGLSLSPVRVKGVKETRGGIIGMTLADVAEEEAQKDFDGPPSPCPQNDDLDLVHPEEKDDYESGLDSYEDEMVHEEHARSYQGTKQEDLQAQAESDRSSSPPLPEPPQLSPLKPSGTAGNRGSAQEHQTREYPASCSTIIEEGTLEVAAAEEASKPTIPQSKIPAQRTLPRTGFGTARSRHSTIPKASAVTNSRTATKIDAPPEKDREVESQLPIEAKPTGKEVTPTIKPPQSITQGKSRSMEALETETASQQSPLTMSSIAAKLAASEREADAARVRAKLKAARGTGGVQKPTLGKSRPSGGDNAPKEKEISYNKNEQENIENVDPVKHDPLPAEESNAKPLKRQRDGRSSKVASRRRSTLSPWELESLISGKAQ